MISSRFKVFTTVVALAAVLAGCASRSVPHAYSQASAASASAPSAPAAVVLRALESDPPLPGTSTPGWAGLAPRSKTITPDGHAGHGAHQHGAPSAPAAATPDHSAHGAHDAH